jgi:hypothetical protein
MVGEAVAPGVAVQEPVVDEETSQGGDVYGAALAPWAQAVGRGVLVVLLTGGEGGPRDVAQHVRAGLALLGQVHQHAVPDEQPYRCALGGPAVRDFAVGG